MNKYNPEKIEEKWQKKWEESDLYKAEDFSDKEKYYFLIEFPYPSGEGLHVGHPRSYTALDILARKKRMEGFNVLYPIGFDAFGLPSENYAIKTGIHPSITTKKNIENFTRQLKSLGYSFDWDRQVTTTDPEYYKWTQWIFLKLYEKGLAYKDKILISWCPSCKIGLANEEVVNGKCERCGHDVEKKEKEQWMLKITAYADRLIDDLKDVDYWERIKTQQINWIGRSEGAEIEFKIPCDTCINKPPKTKFKCADDKVFSVYTTRVDTIFGCTYCVLSPEHELISQLKHKIENYDEVEKYVIAAQNKTELERTELQKEKTGVELKGIKAINPFNNKEIPLYIADYILGHYGTGAVMAVPAHDERDFEFANNNNLEIRQSVAPCFMVTQGKDAIRDDKKVIKRKTVAAIINHWEKDEIFCLDWKKFGWKSFVIGGVEDGESLEDAVIREVKEESGYQNIKSIKKIGEEVHSSFYARHKGENRYAETECYVVELGDGEYIDPKEDDIENHKGEWVARDKVSSYVNLNIHEWFCNIFEKGEAAFTDDGSLIGSDTFSGMTSEKARGEMTKWLEKEGIGKKKINYKMRDWVFSRQRYWGEPIPMYHCEKCGIVPASEDEILKTDKWQLPDVKKYEPTETGESPLAAIDEWVNVKCPNCGGDAKRETDTMPNWAGSSWYFLRYIDPKNNKELADKKKLEYWSPVDWYNGGMEHTTLHLLYSRFWYKFLYDIGVVPKKCGPEPYKKRTSHGMILGEGGEKMSKSRGNVVNPDDIVKEYGADTFRVYEMFMGPFDQAIPWDMQGVIGMKKFLNKIWDFYYQYKTEIDETEISDRRIERELGKTVKKVSEDIETLSFNTAISQIMILMNMIYKTKDELRGSNIKSEQKMSKMKDVHSLVIQISKNDFSKIIILLSPFAPHICEEIWQEKLGHKESIFKEKWPEYDENLIKDEEIELVIQVNGKLRDRINVSADISEEEAKKIALESEKVKSYTEGKEIKKVIFVKGKLISIVI